MKMIFPIILLALLAYSGCDTYEEEYNQSQQTVTALEQRIDSIKSTPAYMYGIAHEKIQNEEYDEENLDEE
mgnify:CR=1 FL=1